VAVAVARASDVAAIGIDVEPLAPLGEDLARFVLAPGDGPATRWLFSAKEAVYKALYPLTGQFLDFCDVSVRFAGDAFTATLLCEAPPFAAGTRLAGARARDGACLATAVTIREGVLGV
jgi:4'-phosphopantetheinyl transferase EntD